MATYRAIMEAEDRLDAHRARLGLSEGVIGDILEEIESGGPVDDLYLRTVARYVAALGGRLEVSAVFGDETVPLLRLPPS